jgi:hypothetical protein
MDIQSIPAAVHAGLNGYKKAEQGVAEAAQEINRLNVEADPVSSSVQPVENNNQQAEPASTLEAESVNLIMNEYLAKANVKVIKTADEMMGSLIDTKV